MPALSPIKFCGLSVIGVQSSLGWGGQASRMNVRMVRDPAAGDTVSPPLVGTPIYAQLGSYSFGGLLKQFTKTTDARGGETYEAICHYPRDLLQNASVILGNYNGTIGVIPNLLNVYGAIEGAGGFGASGATAAGMEWPVVKAQLAAFFASPVASSFGGPLTYKGYSYGVDFTDMPNPPAGYRVGPGVVNLLSLIEQVVRDSGYDYYCDLVGTTIRIRTTDRSVQPSLGLVQAIVESYTNSGILISGTYGSEDAGGEPSSVFLIGGERNTLHQTDGLVNFWGYRPDGTAIVGTGGYSLWAARWKNTTTEAQKALATLPTPRLALSQPAAVTYDVPGDGLAANDNLLVLNPSDYMEWAAISSGHELMQLNALPVADVILATEYTCSTLEMRFALADLDSWVEYLRIVRNDVYQRLHNAEDILPQVAGVLHNMDVLPAGLERAVAEALSVAEEGAAANRERLYNFVRAYAENFYGVQWLSPIPFVSTAVDQDTLNLSYSAEPTSLGWAEEGSGPLGLDAINEDLFTDQTGRFQPFVAFDADGADLSDTGSTDGAVLESTTYYAKCQLTEGVVFVSGSPYALLKTEPFTDQRLDALGGVEEIAALQMKQTEEFVQGFFLLADVPTLAPARRTPLAAAVPLRSNVLTYGPWSATTGAGRVETRQEQSLVPWEYGSEANLNLAALAMVSSSTSAVRTADSGVVEVVGLPLISLGDSLESGPLVTDISIEYGSRGVQTRYQWQTYTPRPGVVGRQFSERIRRDGQLGQQIKRTLRAAGRDATRNGELARRAGVGRRFNEGVSKSVKKNTPHDVFVAHSHQDPDGRVRQQVSVMTAREAVPAVRPDQSELYKAHGAISLNGLLRPITTNSNETATIAKYAYPSGTVPFGLTSSTLFPWPSGNDIDAMAYGQRYTSLRSFRTGGSPTDSRPLALRAPLVLTGVGRTTDLQDTNSTSGTARPDQWKTGPLDPLWDKDRGCWSVHDGAVGVLEGTLAPSGSATMQLWDGRSAMGSRITVYDWTGVGGVSGTRSMALYEPRANRWYNVAAGSGAAASANIFSGSGMLLAEVTVAGTSHTVKRKTWNGSAIADYSPSETYANCRSTTAANLPTGTIVQFNPVIGVSGNYWITPAGNAATGQPGFVTTTAQTFQGVKTFRDNVNVGFAGSHTSLNVFGDVISLAGDGPNNIYLGTVDIGGMPGSVTSQMAPTTPSAFHSFGMGYAVQSTSGSLGYYAAITNSLGTWLYPGYSAVGNNRLINIGRYATFYPSTGKVHDGVTSLNQLGDSYIHGIVTAIGASGLTPTAMVDSAAPLNCLYLSNTTGKLSYKDGAGTVNALY